MANRRSSIKKIRIDKKRHSKNLRIRTELKTVARAVNQLVLNKKAGDAKIDTSLLFSKLDKAVKKGIIHENRASRLKSRLASKIQQ